MCGTVFVQGYAYRCSISFTLSFWNVGRFMFFIVRFICMVRFGTGYNRVFCSFVFYDFALYLCVELS